MLGYDTILGHLRSSQQGSGGRNDPMRRWLHTACPTAWLVYETVLMLRVQVDDPRVPDEPQYVPQDGLFLLIA